MQKISQKIKTARIEAGLTQLQLAKKCKLRQATISDIESGKIDPKYSTVEKIMKIIKFSTELN